MAKKRFSASNAAQLMSCVGSADLSNSIPGWVDPVVDEMAGAKGVGKILHEYLAETSKLSPSELRKLVEALTYMAELRSTRRFKVLAEHEFTAEWLDTKPTTTVDVVLYVNDELHVIDYKTGKIPVRPENNTQLMYYALCAMHLAPKATGAHLHIVQPWADTGCVSWFASATDLAQFMHKAKQAEQKIIAGDPTRTPSDNCTFCPANPHSRSDKGRPLCPEMMQLLYPMGYDEAAILDL